SPAAFRPRNRHCIKPGVAHNGNRTWTGYWGPYGENASGGIPPTDTAVAGASYGYNGAQGKLTDGNIVLMGARPYLPADGRFTQPDPIEGGCANNYTYAFGDPLNNPDLTGQGFGWHSITHFVSKHWRRYLCIGLEGAAIGLAGAAIVASGGTAALALSGASMLAGTIAPLLVHNKAGFEDALLGDAGGLLVAGVLGGTYAGLAGRLSGASARVLSGLGEVSQRVMGIPGIADSYAAASKGPCG
ncbi:MAG: RHS repeat-associated core domain-containing protein, partial [Acidimicrobiales bacterium]